MTQQPPPPYHPYGAASPPPYGPPPYGPPPGHPGHRPPRRGRVVGVALAAVAAVLVLAAAVVVPVLLAREGDDAAAGDGPERVDLSEVREYDDLDLTHVPAGRDVDYPQSPPVGGNHAPAWLECGVYDVELPEEHVVHDLEHGTVWITYREEEVDDDGVDRLARLLPDNGILSPHGQQEAPVVVTVWGRQLALTGPDDPRLPLFVEEYGAGETAPEPLASCHGGLLPDQVPAAPDDRLAA